MGVSASLITPASGPAPGQLKQGGSLWLLAKVPPRLPLSALPARSILLMDNGPCHRWSAKLNRCRARPTVLNASAPHLTPANNQGTSSMSPGSRLRLLTSLPCFSTKAWFHHPSRVGPILWSKNPFSPAQQAGPARFAPKKYFLPRNPFPAKAKPCGWLRQPWLGTEPGALRKV